MFCPYCGTPLDDEALTCTACNSPVEPLKEDTEPATEPQAENAVPKKRFHLSRSLLTASVIAVALTVVVALAIFLLPLLAGKGPATALYIKNGELYTTRLSKLQPWQLTDELMQAADSYTYAGRMDTYTYLTRDGRTIFYPENFSPENQSVTIYYRNIKNHEDDPILLDSNIVEYTVSPDGGSVVYLKSDGTLIRYNMQEKTTVATGIATNYPFPQFYTSEDCKNLIYMVANDHGSYTVYSQTEGGKRRKLSSDCRSIAYINDACDTLYYISSRNHFYKVISGQPKENIAYNVGTVFRVYETGEIYYTTSKPRNAPTITPGYFVVDDAKTDSARDPIRQALASAAALNAEYASTLCYYDGTQSQILAENCILKVDFQNSSTTPYTAAKDVPALIYSCCDISNVEKVNLSQVTNINELTEKITQNITSSRTFFLAVNGTVTQIECEGTSDFRITDDGKTVYYLEKKSNDRTGKLHKFAISDGKAQKTTLYASQVCKFAVLDNSTTLYYCNPSEDMATADLYVNQSLVENNTENGAYAYDTANARLFYFSDNDMLKFWAGGKITEIAKNVHTFESFKKEVLYITDFDQSKGYGTLYMFQHGISQKVDTEVSYIIESNDRFGFVFRHRT